MSNTAMKNYIIKDAIAGSALGPKLGYLYVYDNEVTFEAVDDKAAIALAETLQKQHDAEYKRLGGTDADCKTAPCYVSCLYEVQEEGDKKIE